MPAQRLPMRQVREVLRLKHVTGHSERRIAAAIGTSRYRLFDKACSLTNSRCYRRLTLGSKLLARRTGIPRGAGQHNCLGEAAAAEPAPPRRRPSGSDATEVARFIARGRPLVR